MNKLIVLMLLVLMSPSAQAGEVKTIAYGKDPLQRADIYTPSRCPLTGCPVMIFVHGGGWTNGDKSDHGNPQLGAAWSKEGAIAVILNYRLSPKVVHPAHAQDVAAAVDWTYRNIANYKGNKNKIFLMGHSAGAHLSSLIATDPRYLATYKLTAARTLAGVFVIDPPGYKLADYLNTPLVGKRIRDAFGTNPQVLMSASPFYHVRAGQSYPSFVLAATTTYELNVSSMKEMEVKLRSAGASVEAYPVDYSATTGFGAHRDIFKDLLDPKATLTKVLLQKMGL